MMRCRNLVVGGHGLSRIRRGAAVALLAILWACAAPITVRPLTPDEVPGLQAAANFPHQIYRIESGDTVEIQYTYHADMKQSEVVRPDGKITVQLLGEIAVVGMTTEELKATLVEGTADRLRDPDVTVRIARFAERSVYVGGEVGKPGLVPYERGLTPLQAIIAAGGFRDTARIDSVILVRTQRSGDNFVSRKLNLTEVLTAGTREPLNLAPHDVLYVPRSAIADANLWVRQHLTDLIPFGRTGATLPVPVP